MAPIVRLEPFSIKKKGSYFKIRAMALIVRLEPFPLFTFIVGAICRSH